METLPFDAADYLDDEEMIGAYLEDARRDGPEAIARAEKVVARARARIGDHRSSELLATRRTA